MALRCIPLAALVVAAATTKVTPVEKVITLLEDLQTEVQTEGQQEAAAYDTFACFCSDSTTTKSASIVSTQDSIDSLSATIQQDTATEATKATELEERKVSHEQMTANLEATTVRCEKEHAEHEANVADLTHAVNSLTSAITAMEASKPSLISIKETVADSLALADAMSLIDAPKIKAVQAFLQEGQTVDPASPDYAFHSQGIIDTLTTLQTEFTTAKTQAESDWTSATQACDALKSSIRGDMTANDGAMQTLDGEINTLKTSIAQNKASLVSAEAMLKDDQTYLKDVTKRCETRAKEWDQRSELRANELAALAQALAIISGKVAEKDVSNVRALVQRGAQSPPAQKVAKAAQGKRNISQQANGAAIPQQAATPSKVRRHSPVPSKNESQVQQHPPRRAVAFLQKASSHSTSASSTLKRKQDAARELLLKESGRLQKPALSAIAQRIAADPLGKVKTLIQDLIERLLAESTAEATKKGFCDTELAKAEKDRDSRWADLQKLTADIKSLVAKVDTLESEIQVAADTANSTSTELATATAERATSKAINLETIANATEGLQAVTEAITILKEFYKEAGKSAVALVQAAASPIEEDDPGAGFNGTYAGKQAASTGIIGLLEVIKSDFERTVRTTKASEKKAQEDFVDFDRTAQSSIAEQLKGKELNELDLISTQNALTTTYGDVNSSQSMLDDALRSIVDLAPMCISNQQSYSDRVAAREQEITALKTALCMLDPNQVEAECQTQGP